MMLIRRILVMTHTAYMARTNDQSINIVYIKYRLDLDSMYISQQKHVSMEWKGKMWRQITILMNMQIPRQGYP